MPPSAPAAPQPRSLAQRQREVAMMLIRLDEMLKAAADLALKARERVSIGGLTRYRRFSKRVRDFFALAAVAEEKILATPEFAGSAMTTAHDRLHARMVVLFVESSVVFFDLYARVKHLPIGTYEIMGVELRGLLAIRGFLDDPRYDGERGQRLRAESDRVAEVMRTIMDQVPPLPDFGDAPSIGPKGQTKQPTRPPPSAKAKAAEPESQPLDLRWLEDEG